MKFPFRNTADQYGAVAQLLHWSVVVGITLQFVWAWRIDSTDSLRQQYSLVFEHKSIGMTVLGLVLVRILWRLFNRPPPLPLDTPRWQRRASAATHWTLYLLILAMPLSGWAWSSAAGYGAEFFGLIEIPGFIAANKSWADRLHRVHETLALALVAVISIHVLAALHHHFWLRDSILGRMLPLWK